MIDDIKQGKYDNDLDTIAKAVQARKQALLPQIWEFSVGDLVRLNEQTRPKYLQGKTAKVVKVNRSKIVIDIDGQEFPDKYSGHVTVPLALVDKM
jgi:hypothetical protein